MIKKAIPTGFIIVDDYSRGPLETLSIGDYGKGQNVKADFLGYTRPLQGVPNQATQPMSEKWVVTLSTQYGCPMKCKFCDVPNIKFAGNATQRDLLGQLENALACFPEVKYTERLNIHFARMGEPMFNFDAVHSFARDLYETKRYLPLRVETLHPVFTTSMPMAAKGVTDKLLAWCILKNELYNGQAGLQLSINSTSDDDRERMFSGMAMPLAEVSRVCRALPAPVGRKYCLNFALASSSEVDAVRLLDLFDPEAWMVKITPIHNNAASIGSGLVTLGGYDSWEPYRAAEESLIRAGFDVLTFVPSQDEERGLVTCGNAVLAGSRASA